MVVAVVTTCNKRSYPTRLMADRDIQTHPSWAPACEKCADGLVLQIYRCRDDAGHLWHLGHGEPEPNRKDAAMMATTFDRNADAKTAPLRGGDTWVAVSARGRGQPVEITRVNPVSVYFRATGRGADASQKFKLPIEAFRVRYAPLALAETRQRELARELRNGVAPVPVVMPTPVTEPEPAPADSSPEAPSLSPFEALRPKRVGGRAAKLTAEQAREIWQLYRDDGPIKEIAATYGISETAVITIGRGRDYAWATADLRESAPPLPSRRRPASRVAPSVAPSREESAVQIVTPPTVIAPKPCETTANISPIFSNGRMVQADLLTDMADALDVLVEYAGKPLPRFLKLDLDAVRALVTAARGQAGD
jgi:hypothetical protein